MNFANLKKGFNRKDRKKEKYDVQVRNALSDQSLIYSYGKPYNFIQRHIAEILAKFLGPYRCWRGFTEMGYLVTHKYWES